MKLETVRSLTVMILGLACNNGDPKVEVSLGTNADALADGANPLDAVPEQKPAEVEPTIPLPDGVDEEKVLESLQAIEFGDFEDEIVANPPWVEQNRKIAQGLIDDLGAARTIDAVLHVGGNHQAQVGLASVTLVLELAAASAKDDPKLIDQLVELYAVADAIGQDAVDIEGKVVDKELAATRAKHIRVAIINAVASHPSEKAAALLAEAAQSKVRLVRGAAAGALERR